MTSKININETVVSAATDGGITCARAIELSRQGGFTSLEVGAAMDDNKIRIRQGQLGLFGHGGNKAVKPAENVDARVSGMINARLENGRIPCLAVWDIADELKIKRFDIACACEKLGIRISRCQLGAF